MDTTQGWWLYCHQHPVAKLTPDGADFPWHYFKLHPLPRYQSYAQLFSLEWSMCRYGFTEYVGTPAFSAYMKIFGYIKRHVYLVAQYPGILTIWHDFIMHNDGQSAWFKYGTLYQKYPVQHVNPSVGRFYYSSFTRRYMPTK